MAWIYLLLAGVFEIVWATAMKESAGFTRLWPSLVTLLFMILSFGLLAVSMKTLPLGTAYTIWVGIGAVGAFAWASCSSAKARARCGCWRWG
ncbi:transporter [Pseudomonas aeruginosa]|nr:transporter [Pseudomonas aeruginosa]